ncbi:hypothetical protein BJ878DRAFT_582857 [Calycina marina]|uniref:GYF domain-containing protein n=1 Tax=Calycina marina TaxID=1763456 RepID=A0A9P7Z350_9HELO|nr:hypothetical protein BJ878DRAFT_582857 [Calycina marina]
MPSQTPSSFASAVGAGASRDSRTGRGTDWYSYRSATTIYEHGLGPRSQNGTMTFRRSSTTPYAKSSADPENQQQEQAQGATRQRFGVNELEELFRSQIATSNKDISHLYAPTWEPGQTNGSTRGWAKSSDRPDSNAPESCWAADGKVAPKVLEDKTEEEKELLLDVNSRLKPPPQSASKEINGQVLGANGRKASFGHNSSPFGLASPTTNRPRTGRQHTSDAITGLGSPAGSRFSRDDNPNSFGSRMLNRDSVDDRAEPPFRTTLLRSNTGGSTLGNGPSSPSTWGHAPSSATGGSFGQFSLGTPSTPLTPGEKKAPFGSRFNKFMNKESSEEIPSKASAAGSWRPNRSRTDTAGTDPYASENVAGSAVLRGGRDTSPSRVAGFDTPAEGVSGDFGMSDVSGFRDARSSTHQTPQGRPLSPSDTNPYRSPPDVEVDRDNDNDGPPANRLYNLGGIPEHEPSPFAHINRAFGNTGFEGIDRSQNSSVGTNRPFPAPVGGVNLPPTLSNLGSLGGWPTSATLGTPDGEHRPVFGGAFGNKSVFGSTVELASPGLSSLNTGGFGAVPTSAPGRSERGISSLFPPNLRAEMQANETTTSPIDASHNGFGSIGRNGTYGRGNDSPLRTGRSAFENLDSDSFSHADTLQGPSGNPFSQGYSAQSSFQQQQAPTDPISAQQQRQQITMPDRIMWQYLDPQGIVRGDYSGLEMNDWYKAQFFTADLSVKKKEEAEFEPLGQLIRRIGNSREPFLVPQLGVPHSPKQPSATSFTPTSAIGNSVTQAGSVQPPFAGAFPSFGTTLTAEQQNNLERRKQEEQFLMARQREFLQAHQSMKQMQMSGVPSGLHHQSSTHSLQSQPSFGSMASPIGMPIQPPVQGVPGFFDGPPRQAPTSGMSEFLQQDEMNRLSLHDRQQELFGPNTPASQGIHAQQINALFGQPSDTQQRDVARVEQAQQQPRLREFNQLRAQIEQEEASQQPVAHYLTEPIGHPQQRHSDPVETQFNNASHDAPQPLTLSQKLQQTASAQPSPAQVESPWTKVEPNMPMPFPPPQSTTPLPAPMAQRGRSNLPETLSLETRSRSETPEMTAPPSVAPWAKEPTEALRGPSLKEIQEAEAKDAAKQEEKAAIARRALVDQEMRSIASQPTAPAPGLPTSSTWGTASPATPSVASPWATNAPANVLSSSSAASKKIGTLADIQREEERQKQKAAAAAAAAQPTQALAAGKRYADLASKSSAAPSTSASSWSTVGAGGKAKTPTGPAAAAAQTVRSISSAAVTTVAARSARPAGARSVTTNGQSSMQLAKDEFNKWVKASLMKELPSSINVAVDEVAASLTDFDAESIRLAIYQLSNMAMDGNYFAAEYQRRKKLAEKGVIEPSNIGAGTTFTNAGEKASGWSEVAKKGPPKEESSSSTSGYPFIAKKKKGGKK